MAQQNINQYNFNKWYIKPVPKIFDICLTSDEKDYNNGGGELVILENGVEVVVSPIKGNFAILDFTRNNANHAVNPVKNDFVRYTYINFYENKKIHLEEMEKNTKYK